MKSGLYITEIVKRLYQSEQMKKQFPDPKERLRHIFEKQVYGLAPTEIISHIALPYTVTASLRIPTGFPFHLLLKQTPLCYNFIFFQTMGLYHILSNCQSVLMVGLSKI